MIGWRPTYTITALIWTVLILGGCYQEISRTDPWADLKSIGSSGQPNAGSAGGRRYATLRTVAPEGWAVLLTTFEGSDGQQQAKNLIQQLATEANFQNLWQRTEADRVAVYRGRFADPQSPPAVNALRQTQLVRIDDRRPYATASLVPLGVGSAGAVDALDLKRFEGQDLYSLQIAFFDEDGGAEFREAAQAYARQLRNDDHEAFYYHGPNMSVVTVGLFEPSDIEQVRTPGPGGVPMIRQVYGPRVRQLQEQFPKNLGNGMTVVEKRMDGTQRDQPSFLVPVPR